MSNEIVVKCPSCSTSFSLTKAMSGDLEKDIRSKLEKEISDKINRSSNATIEELKSKISSQESLLRQSQNAEIELRRQSRELEEKARSLQLEVERKLDQERQTIRQRAIQEAEEAHRYRDAEKDKRLSDALAQAEELKRRIEQGSQQTQGEVFELKIEEFLKRLFPNDTIEEVAKGVKGGDILQGVTSKSGVEVGKILWELKRTKSFSEGWISKLKTDARAAKADIMLLVSEAEPPTPFEGGFGEMDGVWISKPDRALALATVLRRALFMAHREKMSKEGVKTKAEEIYQYITGNEFRGRVEAIVESFKGMKEDLESEKRAMEKIWAKRDKQIVLVLKNLAGMHGDFEAISCSEMKLVESLEFKP